MTGKRQRARQTGAGKHIGGSRRAVLGAGSAAAAFLAFGMTPLVSAPAAQADGEFDWLLDLFDPAAWPSADADTAVAFDWGSLFDSSAGLASGDPFDLSAYIDEFVYTPLHAGMVDWIESPLGIEVNSFINETFGFGSIIIGNGAAGIA
ncbi:hypothetical protein ABQF29_21950, partial [Mycolicibacter minnesotensis]